LKSESSSNTSVRKGCPKEALEDFMDTLGKESLSYITVKKWAANLRGAVRVLEMTSGLGGNKRPPIMKLPKLCTIWSCATEGETCESLLGKWV
jgi:hypothetical protein